MASGDSPIIGLKPAHALAMGLGLLALSFLIIALVVGVTAFTQSRIDSAVAISGGLIVLIIALAGLASILSALGLSNHPEAFALPGGSVRSVLAFGVLTALVFFALSQFDTTFAPRVDLKAGQSMTVVGSSSGVAELARTEVKRLRDQGLIIIPTSGTETTRVFAAFAPGENREGADFAKQLLTMFGTLLTAIISFYFGSRVAERKEERDGTGPQGAGERIDGPVSLATAQTQLSALQTRRTTASATLSELTGLRDEARARVAALPEADRPAAQQSLAEAETALDQLQEVARQADAALAGLNSALTAPGAEAAGIPAVTLKEAADKVTALQDASAATAELREHLVSVAQAEG